MGILGVEHIFTSVYHPQSNSVVERFNRVLKTMIRKVVAEDHSGWDLYIPWLLFVVRTSVVPATGFTPFWLLQGRHPRTLADSKLHLRMNSMRSPTEWAKRQRFYIKRVRESKPKLRSVLCGFASLFGVSCMYDSCVWCSQGCNQHYIGWFAGLES